MRNTVATGDGWFTVLPRRQLGKPIKHNQPSKHAWRHSQHAFQRNSSYNMRNNKQESFFPRQNGTANINSGKYFNKQNHFKRRLHINAASKIKLSSIIENLFPLTSSQPLMSINGFPVLKPTKNPPRQHNLN